MEARIIITIRPGEDPQTWHSTHELINITERAAGIILIDIGRDILAALAAHHHDDHSHIAEEVSTNGQ